MKKTIGIIGYGNMGEAIAQQLKSEYKIWVLDKDESKTKNLSGLNLSADTADLAEKAEVVILAVKPQDFEELLAEIKQHATEKLIVSIAAGISTEYIENRLGKVRIIRTMPNLPAKIGKGMICLCRGRYSNQADLDFARKLFDVLGKTLLIEEDLMDAATAVSGSGPGFFYRLIKDKKEGQWQDYATNEFIPQLSAAAEEKGFSGEEARLLATETTNGSIALLKQSGLTPEGLCSQVTSKGGTTEAGLWHLNSTDDLRLSVDAALNRAKELSRH